MAHVQIKHTDPDRYEFVVDGVDLAQQVMLEERP